MSNWLDEPIDLHEAAIAADAGDSGAQAYLHLIAEKYRINAMEVGDDWMELATEIAQAMLLKNEKTARLAKIKKAHAKAKEAKKKAKPVQAIACLWPVGTIVITCERRKGRIAGFGILFEKDCDLGMPTQVYLIADSDNEIFVAYACDVLPQVCEENL